MENNLQRTHAYLQAFERGAPPEEIFAFVDEQATFSQLPNLIHPEGTVVDREKALANLALSRRLLARQTYQVLHAMAQGSMVAVEVKWTGELAVPMKNLQPGQTLTAHCGMFFEWKDGRIVAQRNYDCYRPF